MLDQGYPQAQEVDRIRDDKLAEEISARSDT